jgi:hypothetical protein
MGCELGPLAWQSSAPSSPSLAFIALARGDTGASRRGASSAKCHGCSAFDQRRSQVGIRRFFLDACVCRLHFPLSSLGALPLQKWVNPLISHNFKCGITANACSRCGSPVQVPQLLLDHVSNVLHQRVVRCLLCRGPGPTHPGRRAALSLRPILWNQIVRKARFY